jgi:hypothetical protein
MVGDTIPIRNMILGLGRHGTIHDWEATQYTIYFLWNSARIDPGSMNMFA